MGRAAFLEESQGKNQLSCLFHLLETTHIPWLGAPSSFFKASSVVSWNLSDSDLFSIITSHLTLLWPSFPYKDAFRAHLHNPGQSPHLKICDLITSAESLLRHKVTHSQVPRIRMWTFLKVKCSSLSHIRLFETPWTMACQAPLPMEFCPWNTGVGRQTSLGEHNLASCSLLHHPSCFPPK